MPTKDLIEVEDEFYIRASSALADTRTHVLKHNRLFAVLDRYGDIQLIGQGKQGLFFEGTRHLSHFLTKINDSTPLLLGSEIQKDNIALKVDLANPDFCEGDHVILHRENIHIFRLTFAWNGTLYQRFRIRNYSNESINFTFSASFGADFADIFEVRGMIRKKKGQLLSPEIQDKKIVLRYLGLDDVERQTHIKFSEKPDELVDNKATFAIQLGSKAVTEIFITTTCQLKDQKMSPIEYHDAYEEALDSLIDSHKHSCHVHSSSEQFNGWINSSFVDIHMMITDTKCGPFPFAGIPWYSTFFGRDGMITAYEMLWLNPEIARGTLEFLALHQAKEVDPKADAEPGKIVHEMRGGEMVALGEIPFGAYYGSIDSTLLFIILAHSYYKRTANLEFIQKLWPAIEAGIKWIEEYGDSDGDGFVEYTKRSEHGLEQQGWKDSTDSVFYKDGTLAHPPIALAEVQGYLFAAWKSAAKLATLLGHKELHTKYMDNAKTLQKKFHKQFWIEEMGMYALALDGDKKPCKVKTSNAGQCLFGGIAHPDHAKVMKEKLFAEDMFSEWGIRTVSVDEVKYNPMSYHNGSIWPHDNALIAHGLKKYGFHEEVVKLMSSFLDASLFIDQQRLPELFCGFRRRAVEGPVPYSVACTPQSWATGSVFLFLQSALGLSINAPKKQVRFTKPLLPEFIKTLELSNLVVGEARCDLLIQQMDESISVSVLKKQGDLSVIVEQ